jgi:hypothetical protein
MLHSLCDHSRTDKDTSHSYLDVYEKLFRKKRDTATDVLEIGIGPAHTLNGGSIKLWHDYFLNANIHAVDIIDYADIWSEIKHIYRIKLYPNSDAYSSEFVESTFDSKMFDIIIDDGPHTLESMISFVNLYLPHLKQDGIAIIEDVQSTDWIPKILKHISHEYDVVVYDRRHIKNRWDDVLIVIQKV